MLAQSWKPRVVHFFILTALLFTSTVSSVDAHARQSVNNLTEADWEQIQALVVANIPNSEEAFLEASNKDFEDFFGAAVSISGDTLVVGAPYEDSGAKGVNGNQNSNTLEDSGAAYVFVRSGGIWTQQAYLKASNTGVGDNFGSAVAIYDNTIVIGAPYEDSNAQGVNGNQTNNLAPESGAVYVFTRSGSVWSQQAYIKASNTEPDDSFSHSKDYFGFSVSIDNNTIAVGAYGEWSNATGINGDQSNNSSPQSGAVYVFTRSGTIWSQQAYIKASNTDSYDKFGKDISLSGETLAVGASEEKSAAKGVNGNQSDDSKLAAGAAYVFTRNGSTWSQQAYVKASNTDSFDYFGGSVSISGNTLVVGAHGEKSNATGVNGNQTNNTLDLAGAAYVYFFDGSNWSQQAYLKASNTGEGDHFGWSVAASGDAIFIGAYQENGDANAINGNQENNSPSAGVLYTGAGYLFTRSVTTWRQETYLKASNASDWNKFGVCASLDGDTLAVGSNVGSSFGSSGPGGAYVFSYTPTSTTTLNSIAVNDGWTLESTETSGIGGTKNSGATTFNVGDDAQNRQYRGILDFDTSSLPDNAIITNVTLKIKKQGLVGTDPFTTHQYIYIDVKAPAFSGNASLQNEDFQAAKSLDSVDTITNNPVNNWYSNFLNTRSLAFIGKTKDTQFRLRFRIDDDNDGVADFIKFFSGNHATANVRPTLIIEYFVP